MPTPKGTKSKATLGGVAKPLPPFTVEEGDRIWVDVTSSGFEHAIGQIERGEVVDDPLFRELVIQELRATVKRIRAGRPKTRGHQPKLLPGQAVPDALIRLVAQHGLSLNAAYEELAARADVSVEAIKKHLKTEQGEWTIKMLRQLRVTKPKR